MDYRLKRVESDAVDLLPVTPARTKWEMMSKGGSNAMKRKGTDFFNTVMLGAIVVLIPLILVILLAEKLIQWASAVVHRLANALSLDTAVGAVLLIPFALLVIVGICFFGGLIAKGPLFKKIRNGSAAALSAIVPGFAFVKSFGDSLQSSEEYAENFIPVVVQFDEYSQIAFEIERDPGGGRVALYLPGAPSPWSGGVVYVTPERVRRLQMSVREALTNIRMLGGGSVAYSKRIRSD
ncbi:MAG: hypothetical protein K0U76_05005 [Actinomycetia bacterium]|nr:hypothetical protein [Actinomycetes bacterium]